MLQPVFKAIAARDTERALSLARQAVADNPDSHQAQHALGLALHLAGELDAAAEALDRAISIAPHEAGYHLARASLALGQGDVERADSAVSQAVTSNPNQLGAYVFGAHLALARGDQDEAEKQLKLAQKINPEHPVVFAIEGSLAELKGDRDRAIKLLAAAAQASPEDPLILSSLGLTYLKAGNNAFAEQALRKALAVRPDVLRLRWALIEALRRQNRVDELPQELETLLAAQPGEARALALLGDCLLQQGKAEEAVAAYRRLLALRPLPNVALDGVIDVLARVGLVASARELVEEQLAKEPENDDFWQRRVALDAGEPAQVDAALERWQQAQPNSAIMHGVRAQVAEARGQLEAAADAAETCLALQPTLIGALQVKMRGLIRRDAQAALDFADQIAAQSQSDYGRRLSQVWRGFALDRLQRGTEAAAQWRAAAEGNELPSGLPSVTPASAMPAPNEGAQAAPARLLWGPPGSRVMELVGLLRQAPDVVMLDDRFGSGPRDDGLWPPRADGAIARSAGWRLLLERAKLNPDQAVDWLPHWDGRVDAVLSDALLIAVIADPRDLFVNALVHGGPQPWPMPAPAALASWLSEALEVLAQRRERAPERTLLVTAAELREAPAEALQRVADALGLQQLPPLEGLEQSRLGPGELPLCFAPGRWKLYAEGFAAEFAQLAPLAARLGFAD